MQNLMIEAKKRDDKINQEKLEKERLEAQEKLNKENEEKQQEQKINNIKAQSITANYGKYPKNYKKIIIDFMSTSLFDPYSVKYNFSPPEKSNPILDFNSDINIFCYRVKATINAKNRYGGYTGGQSTYFYIRDNNIIEMVDAWIVYRRQLIDNHPTK